MAEDKNDLLQDTIPAEIAPNQIKADQAQPVAATTTGKKHIKAQQKVAQSIKNAEELETVTLVKENGQEFTIGKAIYDAEMAKPVDIKDVKAGEPVLLRHPDIAKAKIK